MSKKFTRSTKETKIKTSVKIYGNAKAKINTGIQYLNHMLEIFSFHSLIDIKLDAAGDFIHHIAEDVGISLGNCISNELGERNGIRRFGSSSVPMDDALASASIDLAKRSYTVIELKIEKEGVEDMVSEDIYHFIRSLTTAINCNIHINVEYGENDHHKIEAAFKALALAFRKAVSVDLKRKGTPSSKGLM